MTQKLPDVFERWFDDKGWHLRAHQQDVLELVLAGKSNLLVAPTGAGKTLAGFLPSLVDLAQNPHEGLHTLYISPLKALAVDVARNLETPIHDLDLPIRVETRTGDTPASKKSRQRYDPPHILMTTPEQLALILSHADSLKMLGSLKRIILDELHALVTSKRGDMLGLGLARLRQWAPHAQATGLSATVPDADLLARWMVGVGTPRPDIVRASAAAQPEVEVLYSKTHVPWAGHTTLYAVPELYELIGKHQTSLLFVNTRSQAELLFQALWDINADHLPIALHHGSLDATQRRKVEAAMVKGQLRAVVCTSTLDLGIDWGDVDLVLQIGAPKGSSRLLQRIGRSNHRMDEPSKAVLVPSSRFEVLECQAARDAVADNAQDAEGPRKGALDVLVQHVVGLSCAIPFKAPDLYEEVISAWPYKDLSWSDFERVVDCAATGGYALRAYDRYARIRMDKDEHWRIANPTAAQHYRMNAGTIVEEAKLNVRLIRSRHQLKKDGKVQSPIGCGGRMLGRIESYFIEQLVPGDSFIFGGEVLAFEAVIGEDAFVSRTAARSPKIPAYMGGKFPLSTYLAKRVRAILANPKKWDQLPAQVRDWLALQQEFSQLPDGDHLLVETFPRSDRFYLVCYPYEGRLAHQTLGMLLTRRLERLGQRPMGFVASEYALSIWGLADLSQSVAKGQLDWAELFDEDMLGDDLESWLLESSLMKRTFRNCALISGLIERRHPGKEKTSRQLTFSTDLLFDTLFQHEPDHILMEAARADAATGLLDIGRLGEMLARIKGKINHKPLEMISPMAVPVMMEIGREPIYGEAQESLLEDAEAGTNLANDPAIEMWMKKLDG